MVDDGLSRALERIVSRDGLVNDSSALRVYECDGYTIEKSAPELVVLPQSIEELSALCTLLHRENISFVPRGAGTGLSGGCLPIEAPVMICTSRMRRIIDLDPIDRLAVVEAGVVNAAVTRAASKFGLYYAPDPSSQSACTIGGNIAENSGGPHTLKYGVTTNHVMGLRMVLPDGEILVIGSDGEDHSGYDLCGLVVGSEGTCGIVGEATLRLIPQAKACRTLLAVFDSVATATTTVSAIVGAGIVPAALEMMDQLIVKAIEEAYSFGFPTDAGAVLLIELDGFPIEVETSMHEVIDICQRSGSRETRIAADEQERAALWKCRKRAFGAVGRLAPNYCTQDGVVPRTKLADILKRIEEVAEEYQLRIGNVFHAGDGNIHPILLYNESDPEEVSRVVKAGREILAACVEFGGSLTGEHGIGVEKAGQMSLLFSESDLEMMFRLRRVFDPDERCNPGKIFPTPGGCVETRLPRRQAAM